MNTIEHAKETAERFYIAAENADKWTAADVESAVSEALDALRNGSIYPIARILDAMAWPAVDMPSMRMSLETAREVADALFSKRPVESAYLFLECGFSLPWSLEEVLGTLKSNDKHGIFLMSAYLFGEMHRKGGWEFNHEIVPLLVREVVSGNIPVETVFSGASKTLGSKASEWNFWKDRFSNDFLSFLDTVPWEIQPANNPKAFRTISSVAPMVGFPVPEAAASWSGKVLRETGRQFELGNADDIAVFGGILRECVENVDEELLVKLFDFAEKLFENDGIPASVKDILEEMTIRVAADAPFDNGVVL